LPPYQKPPELLAEPEVRRGQNSSSLLKSYPCTGVWRESAGVCQGERAYVKSERRARRGSRPSFESMTQRFKLISAVHLFLEEESRILLLRRFNTGWGDGLLSVVAGHLEGGEELALAAAREAWEEVGIEIPPSQLQVVGVMHRKEEDERIDFFLRASKWRGRPRICEPERCSELLWSELVNLPPDVVPYVRQAIDNYRHGVWFQSYGWSAQRSDRGPIPGGPVTERA
jgi:8-oxo-dGTP diphosphatase